MSPKPSSSNSTDAPHRRWRRWEVIVGLVGLALAVPGAIAETLQLSHGGSSTTTPVAATTTHRTTSSTFVTNALNAKQRARAEEVEALRRREKARHEADHELRGFVVDAMNRGLGCDSVSDLPDGAVAQLTCKVNGTSLTFTRLRSKHATTHYLSHRFSRTARYAGSAGPCTSAGETLGTWHHATGPDVGDWGLRRSGNRAILLWSYWAQHVAVRASRSLGSRLALCDVWYATS
jgi:hypothetical protein